MLLNDDDFELLEGDISVSKEGAYPKSSFSDRVQDYNKALTKGPLVVFGHYLMVYIAIEGMIGTIVKLDYNTTVGKRGKFARFRVVIDLNKPLLIQINIDGSQYNIKDEGLPKICYVCGCFGHLKENCVKQEVEAIKNLEVQSKNGKGSKVVETSSNFGSWMQDTVVNEGNNDQRIDIGVVENIQRRKKGKGKIPQGSGLINVVTKGKPEEDSWGSRKASRPRDMLSDLEGRVAKLEGSMGYVREDLEEVEGRTIELELRQDQIKGQVAEALNANVGAMQKVLNTAVGELTKKDNVLEAMVMALKEKV
ncbi:hypothetical protein Goklo_013747 [Gossypium klotzschianum]|uniref:CCHC-type domain-containing protein n=1 Tax=Gossypium klotzschianum TaxID=34286 RepID=A0A7J8U5Z7_9ROSI|nr:hypothetical protein [Gossypium klotzschianum]